MGYGMTEERLHRGGYIETTFDAMVEEALDKAADICGSCRHYLPGGLMGWAANGRVLRSSEGMCAALRCVVDVTLPYECDAFERRS